MNMKEYAEHDSPLGPLLLAATARGLCGIYFAEHKHFKGKQDWRHAPDNPVLLQTARQLDEYFAQRRVRFDLPLDMDSGTEFQRSVWQALTAIPFGHSASYAALAQRLGKPRAVRAVGAANGRNPLSIVVPCHRVIGATGALTGYAGGLERKAYLLKLEGLSFQ
jgi:methylated-DNA-[protein]-cysteine S-methyltransferase